MRLVRTIALRVPRLVGSPLSFLTAIVLALIWVIAGFFLHWNDSWLLWPSAIASVFTFLIVFSLQYTQNRDTRAIQLKLDEILRTTDRARTELVKLEQLSDDEVGQIELDILSRRDDELPG